MAKTKGEVVRTALAHLGLVDYEFDVTPEELATGVDFLNIMMSFWSGKNLKVPYNFEGETEDDSGLPDTAIEAVVTNLAIRLAPTFGKQTPLEVRTTAKQSLNALYSESARPIEQQLDAIPSGAGHKERNFFTPTDKYPWEIEALDDFSGGEADFFVDDVGVVISLDFFGNVDLSTATATTIRYRKPTGEEGTWTGTVNGTAVDYTTVADDIDEAGTWYFQAFAEYADGTVVSSKVGSRWVADTVKDGT